MKDYDVVRIKETVFLKPLFGDAFLYSGGQMIDLGTLGGSNSDASGVNNGGQIVGYSGIIGDSTYHAFLYSRGKMQDLNELLEPHSG